MASKKCSTLTLFLLVLLLADAVTMGYSVLKGPFPLAVAMGAPTAYLNIFVHVPLAMSSYLVFGLALVFGVLYLAKREEKYDRLTYRAVLVGEVYSVFTIITGMAWAKESWGVAWNWDPRETGVLLLLLSYLGYFALRNSIPDPERKRLVSNAYAIAAFAMVPISFAAPYIFSSLHPSFRQAQSFMWTGSAALLMASRILLAMSVAITLVVLPYKANINKCSPRSLIYVGLLFLVLTGIIAGIVASPYLKGEPVRALRVGTTPDGRITWILLSNGTNLTFGEPVSNPVKPSFTAQNTSSLTMHVVLIENGRIVVVRHWCVAFNIAMYGLMVALALALQSLIKKY